MFSQAFFKLFFPFVVSAVLIFIIAISLQAQSPAVDWVQIDIDASAKDADHMIGAEERSMVSMARQ